MTIFSYIAGNREINDRNTKIRFVAKWHQESVDRGVLGCFPGRVHFIGMISNVVVTPEFIKLLTDHAIPFSVSGHANDDKLVCNKLDCNNCFFVGGHDVDGKRLAHMIGQDTACELVL